MDLSSTSIFLGRLQQHVDSHTKSNTTLSATAPIHKSVPPRTQHLSFSPSEKSLTSSKRARLSERFDRVLFSRPLPPVSTITRNVSRCQSIVDCGINGLTCMVASLWIEYTSQYNRRTCRSDRHGSCGAIFQS